MVVLPLPERADSPRSKIIQDAPIDSLPNELLISIFEIVRCTPIPWSTGVPFAVVASHVSRRWRSIAISTSSFWTNIFITSLQHIGRVASYFERSGQRSVDVTYYPRPVWNLSSVEVLSNLLASNSHRWRRLVLLSANSSHLQTIMTQMRDIDAPKLECLRVIDRVAEYNYAPSFLSQFATSRASLTTLELTTLKGNIRPSYNDFRLFVQSCSSLQTLVLQTCSIQAFPSPIILTDIPTLRTLTFSGDTRDEQFYSFFEFLSTPAIDTLELCDMDNEEWIYFCEWMEETSAPQYPNLQSLILVDVLVGDHLDDSFADACPLLRHLAIHGDQFSRSLVMTLAGWSYFLGGNGSANIRWKHLRALSISDITASSELIRHVVDGRIAAGVPLHKIRLDRLTQRNTPVDVLPSIQLEMFDFEKRSHRFHQHILESSENEITWTKELWKGGIDE